jgi:DNA-binding MarR family transcriptional regulator
MTAVDSIVESFDQLWRRMAATRSTDFVLIDVTMAQAKVLHLVCIRPGSTMSWIADRLHVTLPTVSGLVDRLVEHGLVSRREDPADRRQVIIDLTDAGWAEIGRFRDVGRGRLRTLLTLLTPAELDHLARGVAALAAHAAELPGDDLPPFERTSR